MRRPVNKPYRISTKYGKVPGYRLNDGFHTGIDYVSEDKKNVATLNGKITAIGELPKDGIYIVLEGKDKGKAARCWYAHNKRGSLKVKVGDTVKAGQQLATMGETGEADGVHLHFSLRINGVMVNPEKYMEETVCYITMDQQRVLYRMYLGRDVSPTGKANVGKKTFEHEQKRLRSTKTYKELQKQAKAGKLEPENHLPFTLRSIYKEK